VPRYDHRFVFPSNLKLTNFHFFFSSVNDHGDANITVFSILPAQGRQGTTFSIDVTFVSLNGTGTGELDIEIHTVDHIPLGGSFLMEAKKPGTYSERISVKAEPDPQCDPTQGKLLKISFEQTEYLVRSFSF